jgi:hypothetical protein
LQWHFFELLSDDFDNLTVTSVYEDWRKWVSFQISALACFMRVLGVGLALPQQSGWAVISFLENS